MSTTRAQQSDRPELEALYRRNHPDASRGIPRRRWWSQTFVDRHGAHPHRLQGFAVATYAGPKDRRHGAIRMLEIEPSLKSGKHGDLIYASAVRGLIQVCQAWLEAQWCTSADLTVLTQSEHAWVLPQIGAKPGPSGTVIRLVPRLPEWHLQLDGRAGLIRSVTGPEGRPPGPQPEPFKMPDQLWA